MSDKDDFPYLVVEKQKSGVGLFFWGALLGAGAALLLAPRSGSELQKDIRDTYSKARRDAADKVDDLRSTVENTTSRIGDQIGNVASQVSRDQDRASAPAERAKPDKSGTRSETADNATAIAREARAEMQRGVADARGAESDNADPPDGSSKVVVTDVSEEQADDRADLG